MRLIHASGMAAIAAFLAGGTAWAQSASLLRVAVTDIQPLDVPAEEVAPATEVIAHQIARHAGYAVIPLARVREGFGPLERPQDCVLDDACIVRLAASVKADVVVFASVATSDRKYELTITLVDPRRPAERQRASEEMRSLSSVDMNVPDCLEQLFHWDAGTPIVNPNLQPVVIMPGPVPVHPLPSGPLVVPLQQQPTLVPLKPSGPLVVPLQQQPTLVPLQAQPTMVPLKPGPTLIPLREAGSAPDP
jgi:hypothetical protein